MIFILIILPNDLLNIYIINIKLYTTQIGIRFLTTMQQAQMRKIDIVILNNYAAFQPPPLGTSKSQRLMFLFRLGRFSKAS